MEQDIPPPRNASFGPRDHVILKFALGRIATQGMPCGIVFGSRDRLESSILINRHQLLVRGQVFGVQPSKTRWLLAKQRVLLGCLDAQVQNRRAIGLTAHVRTIALTPRPLKIKTEVGIGKAYQQIIQFAMEAQIDMVAMGVRGRDALDLPVFGSTTYRVIRLGPCPVLVHVRIVRYRSKPTPPRRPSRVSGGGSLAVKEIVNSSAFRSLKGAGLRRCSSTACQNRLSYHAAFWINPPAGPPAQETISDFPSTWIASERFKCTPLKAP